MLAGSPVGDNLHYRIKEGNIYTLEIMTNTNVAGKVGQSVSKITEQTKQDKGKGINTSTEPAQSLFHLPPVSARFYVHL